MAGPLSREEFAAYAALVEGSTLLQRAVEKNLLEQANVTQAQFEILMELAEAPDGLRMAGLADRLIVSRSGLSYQVSQMEKAGLITRERHDEDERGIVARITPAGAELRERILPGHLELVRRSFFNILSPEELKTLADALGRVAAQLREAG